MCPCVYVSGQGHSQGLLAALGATPPPLPRTRALFGTCRGAKAVPTPPLTFVQPPLPWNSCMVTARRVIEPWHSLRCAFYLSSTPETNWKLKIRKCWGGGWTIKESFRPNLQCLNYMHVYNCKKMYIKCTCMEGPVRYKSINDLYFIILQIFKIDKWLYTNLGHRNIYHNKIVCVRCCNLCVDSSCQNSLSYQLRYQPPPPSRIRKCHFFTFSIFILVKSLNQ